MSRNKHQHGITLVFIFWDIDYFLTRFVIRTSDLFCKDIFSIVIGTKTQAMENEFKKKSFKSFRSFSKMFQSTADTDFIKSFLQIQDSGKYLYKATKQILSATINNNKRGEL